MAYTKEYNNNSKDLTQRINIEKKFADYIYKEFRAIRFGLASCCSLDQMEKFKIKKEICDWYDNEIETYSKIDYEYKDFFPIPENNPDLFESNTETITTITPIVTYTTTIIVPGEPIYVVDECQNNCVYPQIFKPTEAQLFNVGTSNQLDSITGEEQNNGLLTQQMVANAAVKLNPFDLLNIPNNSGNAEITFYAPISAQAMFAYFINDSNIPINALSEPLVTDTMNFPPDLSAPTYYVPVSQFTLIPGISNNGDSIYTAAYRYKDPGLDVIGNGTSQEILVNGETMFKNDVDQEIVPTFFGNTKSFQVSLGTANDFYNLNGGLFYGTNNYTVQMRIVVKDGLDVYYIDPLIGGLGLNFNFPDPDVYYYANENISGNFVGTETLAFETPFLFEQNIVQEQFQKASCSFNYGIGTITTADNISLQGNIIEPGVLDNKCTFIGIETTEEEVITTTEGGETITETVITFTCKTDDEYIVFKVCDQNGDYIEGYEIILDGGSIGKTDQFGVLKTTIPNASVNKKHTVNICYCFETTGACTQKEIKITVTDDEIVDLTINKADCINISESE
tara:strand:- start:724 stop:2421 length:1698 start_codon:yes stop_codon:yes gene_type:complete